MNKTQQELLDKCIKVDLSTELPLFKGIMIIQQRKLHDSGYRQMYVIGHTEYDEKIKDFKYYLIGTYSDVINFRPPFEKLIKGGKMSITELALDIDRNGIIHIWLRNNERLKVEIPCLSSCILETVGGNYE